jgi:hypothetical protein
MTTLLVQEFLRNGGTVAGLLEKYAIKSRRHLEFPNLVCFKYNQIDSPFAEPLVRECRGIILDESDGWRVVARTFDKFFNYGEGHAAPIDWPTARVQEKCDGSLMQLYWYRDAWRVASSGMPDASGHVMSVQQDGTESFAALFWATFKALGFAFPERREFTYALELMTPQNRVVVPHAQPALVLLAARSVETGEEVRPATVWSGPPVVREFSLASFDDCLASFERIDPLRQEGYVVVDGRWNRVKVKHPGYVAIAHMAGGGFTPRRVLDVVRSGETGEILANFPEWRPLFDDLGGRFSGLVAELDASLAALAHIPAGKEGQKAFALEANRTRYPSALFQVRAGKSASVREFLAKVQIDHLLRALNVKDEPEAEAA